MVGSPGLLRTSRVECGFGAKSGTIGAGHTLHLGPPNSICFPDEPVCNSKHPRDINPAKTKRDVRSDGVRRGRWPRSGREGAGERRGWVLAGSCHVWGRCREGRVISRMGEEGERSSLAGGCRLGIACRCLQGTGACGSPSSPKIAVRGERGGRREWGGMLCRRRNRGCEGLWGSDNSLYCSSRDPGRTRSKRSVTGGQCPQGSNPLGICFLSSSPIPSPPPGSFVWNGNGSAQKPLPAS